MDLLLQMGGRDLHADAAQSVARHLLMQQRRHAVEWQERRAVIHDGQRAEPGAAASAACTAKPASQSSRRRHVGAQTPGDAGERKCGRVRTEQSRGVPESSQTASAAGQS